MIPLSVADPFARGQQVCGDAIAALITRAYGSDRNFPIIEADDPDRAGKQNFLDALDEIHGNYEGALPWMLLNGMAETVADGIGKPSPVVAPGIQESQDDLLFDALVHALEATGRLNLDVMATTSRRAGIVYYHGHDCDDCGIIGKVEVPDLSPAQRAQLGRDFMAQLFVCAENIQRGMPYALLPKCSAVATSLVN